MGGPAMLAGMGWVAALAAVLVALWLRAALARRAALVAEAAHELRAPLCAAGLALHGAARDPRRLAAAERELVRAGLALEDLSCAPRGRRAPVVREVLDVREVVGQVVEARQDEALGRGAGLYLDAGTVPALVLGGRLRLVQAVGNLVANAAEHGWGDIDVRVRTWRKRVTIEVADQGAGPGPERVAAAVRGATPSRGAHGHGLRIAAAVAARHGGMLRTAGRSVVLDLPRADPRAAPDLSGDARRGSGAAPKLRAIGSRRAPAPPRALGAPRRWSRPDRAVPRIPAPPPAAGVPTADAARPGPATASPLGPNAAASIAAARPGARDEPPAAGPDASRPEVDEDASGAPGPAGRGVAAPGRR